MVMFGETRYPIRAALGVSAIWVSFFQIWKLSSTPVTPPGVVGAWLWSRVPLMFRNSEYTHLKMPELVSVEVGPA
jgi:hypothetical protein